MSITPERIVAFVHYALQLSSFPLFCAYLAMVFLSPVWQRFTRPLALRWVLVVYNSFTTMLNLITAVGLLWGLFEAGNIFHKQNFEPLRPFMWLYWISKQLELLDTVFMVLRHRRRQLTFLHVYHHASMVLLTDAGYHSWYWPAVAFPLTLNALVHVVLYLYYSLAALLPNQPPTWRKLLTQTQILQFLIDLVFAIQGYMYHGFCIYGFIYGILMLGLFSHFYYQAYVRVKPIGRAKAADNDSKRITNASNGKTHGD